MLYLNAPSFFQITCLPLKKFPKMHDDVMMIRVSVKTTRMYANGFNAPKDNCLNSGIEFFYFDF